MLFQVASQLRGRPPFSLAAVCAWWVVHDEWSMVDGACGQLMVHVVRWETWTMMTHVSLAPASARSPCEKGEGGRGDCMNFNVIGAHGRMHAEHEAWTPGATA